MKTTTTSSVDLMIRCSAKNSLIFSLMVSFFLSWFAIGRFEIIMKMVRESAVENWKT